MQCDLDDVYFNCFLLEPKLITVGNIPHGFTCRVECDAPWAWEFPRKSTFVTQAVETNLEFYNNSDDSEYLYPIINFTLDMNTTNISVVNADDDNRATSFVNLNPNEKIYLNNDLEIITSSTGLNRLPRFNGKWFRFVQGLNRIKIVGGLSSVEVAYQFARKVGS
jgi:phage-related protein